MNSFPTIKAAAKIRSWSDNYSDEAVKIASFASGYPCINMLFTFDPRTWTDVREDVDETDKKTVMAFYQANKDRSFYWLNEQDETVYEVIFTGRPETSLMDDDDRERWRIAMTLRQTSATELPTTFLTHKYYGGDAMIEVENLAAGVDITLRAAWVPNDNTTIYSVMLLTKGTPLGIDNSNTVVLTLTDKLGNVVWTKTYNTATQPPTNSAEDVSSGLDADYAEVDAGDPLTLTVTQGATANMPAFSIVIGAYFR